MLDSNMFKGKTNKQAYMNLNMWKLVCLINVKHMNIIQEHLIEIFNILKINKNNYK